MRTGFVECKGLGHIVPTLTLPETNIAPETRPPKKESSLPNIHFRLLVSGRIVWLIFLQDIICIGEYAPISWIL